MAIKITKPTVDIGERLSIAEGVSLENFKAMDATFSGNVGIRNNDPNLPLTITSNSGANAIAIRARSDDDYGFIQFYNHAGTALRGQIFNHNGAMSISTSTTGTVRLHIDTSGNVGIGTSLPTNTSGYTTLNVGAGSIGSIIKIDGVTSGHYHRIVNNNGQLLIQADQGNTTGNSAIVFDVDDTERMRIDEFGGLVIKSVGGVTAAAFHGQNLVNGITAVPSGVGTPFVLGRDTGTLRSAHFGGNLKFDSGYGVTFSVAGGTGTPTSGTLDDYEEGTFTPVITGTTGTPTVTYSTQSGTYTKIGRTVYYRIGLRVNSISGGSGILSVTGLPFTAKSYGAYANPFSMANNGGMVTSQVGPIVLYVESGASTIQGRYANTNADSVFPLSEIQATTYMVAEGFYETS